MKKIKVKSIFISDVHLGARACNPEFLESFLKRYDCENLFLVGDIIDFWRLKRTKSYWPQSHNNILRKFLSYSKNETRVVYLPGNHDDLVRSYIDFGVSFGNIEIHDEYIYESNGKKFLLTHGDYYDGITNLAPWLVHFGDRLYNFALRINKIVSFFRRRLGLPYWSFSNYCKQQTKSAIKFMHDYETRLTDEAKKRGLDGVICGHIHKAEMKSINGIMYYNCGDWTEGCCGLVEHTNGRFETICIRTISQTA